jgi:hypothetical protein
LFFAQYYCKEKHDLRFLYVTAFDLEVRAERLLTMAMLQEYDDGMLV